MDVLASIETVLDSDLVHHGRKGQKWGVKNGPPYPLHPEQLSSAEKKSRRSVFISGSSKTQSEDSGYYRKELPKAIQNKIDEYIKDHAYIVVGDAPGIDRQVQDYLNEKGYDAVEVYGPGKQVRYTANEKWKTNPVDAPEYEEMSPEWLRKKDIAMTNDATEGLAIVLDEGAKATRNNVERLREQGKAAEVFVLNQIGDDDWEHTKGSYETLDKALERLTPAETNVAVEDYVVPDLTPAQKEFLFKDNDKKELTEVGRKVLERYEADNFLKPNLETKTETFDKEGIKILDGRYQIDKAAHVRRLAGANEPIDERHKYVSLTEADSRNYNDSLSDYYYNTRLYTYEYSTKHKLNIADEKQVFDYLVEAYGDRENKQRASDYVNYIQGHYTDGVLMRDGKSVPTWHDLYISRYASSVEKDVKRLANDVLFKRSLKPNNGYDELYTHFKKLGYDAIVDVEDYLSGYTDLPLVVLNPKDSLKLVKSKDSIDYSLISAYREYQKSKTLSHSDFLSHHGVQGQQWGVRHWQNPDGTLTPAGRERWISSLKYEAYQAAKKWEEYQKVRKQVVDMHYNGQFDSNLEKQMRDLKEEANKSGAIWGFLRKRVESYLENGPESSTSEPVTEAPHKVLVPVGDEERYQHFLDLGYVEKGRNDIWIYMINTDKYIRYSEEIQNDVLAAVEEVIDEDAVHYQRKGAKWGIRNGPPYPLDRSQFSEAEKAADPDTEAKQHMREAGIKRKNRHTDIIKRGSTFVRQATKNDEKFHDRKYMSVTESDANYYRKECRGTAEYVYEAKRDLKVANADSVVDYIVNDMLGYRNSEEGKKLSSLYEKYLSKPGQEFSEPENKERYEFFSKVISKQRTRHGREGDEQFETQRQILDHFSSLGYDAMVDINQSWQGMEYPVIIIDPDDSTKLKTKIERRFLLKDKVVNY